MNGGESKKTDRIMTTAEQAVFTFEVLAQDLRKELAQETDPELRRIKEELIGLAERRVILVQEKLRAQETNDSGAENRIQDEEKENQKRFDELLGRHRALRLAKRT